MQLTRRPSRFVLGASALVLSATLAACAGAPASTPTPDPAATASAAATPEATPTPSREPIPASNNLDAVTVAGAYGAAPQVTVPAPFAIDETRTKTLVEGNQAAPAAAADSTVEVNYVGINGRTGETFDSSWDRGQPAPFPLSQVVPGFTKGLTGTRPGQRVVIAMPGPDGYDAAGGNPPAIEVGDTLVFVVDVLAVSAQEPSGTPETPELPVTLGDDAGKPTVAIPTGTTPPADLLVAPVIRGVQPAVEAGDTVVVRYRAWSWKTGEMVEDKFDAPVAGAIDETIEAWKRGLVGQPIGSRVVLVAPPALGYDKPSQNPPIEAGDTIVYVIDVLFASAG